MIYRCPLCKNSIDAEEVHSEIMKELTSKWFILLSKMNHEIANLLAKRKTKLVHYRDTVQQQLKEINVKRDSLYHSPEDVYNSSEWDFILSVSKSKIKDDLFKANSFIEQIEALEKDLQSNQLFAFFEKMEINKLKNPEIRTIFLTLFKRISIDFENGNLVFVNYQLAPFTEIDQYLESIN